MVYFCLLLTLLSALLSKSHLQAGTGKRLLSALIFLSFLICGLFLLSDYLTDDGINEAFLYHLSADKSGVGLGDFRAAIITSVAYLVTVAGISLFPLIPTSRGPKRAQSKCRSALATLFVWVAIAFSPGTAGLYGLAEILILPNPLQDAPTSYIEVEPDTNINAKKNLVYIYLESLELTYLDQQMFPGLAPNLVSLGERAIQFTDIRETYGTGWTIAGMVSSQCGIPLVTPGDSNSVSGMGRFLPDAVCVGDMLKANGYALSYMGGASLNFAGKGSFYKDHGFESVEGVDELLPKLEDPDYRNWWGLYDDSLYPLLFKRIKSLHATAQPFGLFTLTLDTHHPNGNVSASCKSKPYLDGANPMLNAVHCADYLVGQFVEKLAANNLLENTVLVIASDHLAMRNTATDRLKTLPRRDLALILGADISPRTITKTGTTLDLSATVTSLIGGEISAMGFGRNLLSDSPTLAETSPDWHKELRSYRPFLSSLWNFPQVYSGLIIDTELGSASLGPQALRLPVVIQLNETLGVQEVLFDFFDADGLRKRIEQFDDTQRFLWVDACSEVMPIVDRKLRTVHTRYCVVMGSLATEKLTVLSVENGETLSYKQISSYFHAMTQTSSTADWRREQLRNYTLTGVLDAQALDTSLLGAEKITITSFGGPHQGTSFARTDARGSLSLKRGLNVIAAAADGTLMTIAHADTCSAALVDANGSTADILPRITEAATEYPVLFIVAHDSAVCQQNSLTPVAHLLGLKKMTDLKLREPYIAAVTPQEVLLEIKGSAGASLTVVVNANN